MGASIANLLLLVFLVPAGIVFVLAYRHALRDWLKRPDEHVPGAVVARNRALLDRHGDGRRFHAVAIGAAFASIFVMSVLAAAMIATALLAA